MNNIGLADVLNCIRVMNYNGNNIQYITGISSGDVQLSALDCFEVLKNDTRSIGYVVDLTDFVTMMTKSNTISKSILMSFNDVEIADYLSDTYIPINTVIGICDQYKADMFRNFLRKAKTTISDIGLYLENSSFINAQKRSCTDKNLADSLDLKALSDYAYKNNMDDNFTYLEICNMVSDIVFSDNLENVRINLNLYFDDYLCNFITQEEYNEIHFCCKVISYLMNYSDISLNGIEIFTRIALNSVITKSNKTQSQTGLKRRETNGYNSLNDSVEEYNDDESVYYKPLTKRAESNKELNDFKRNM